MLTVAQIVGIPGGSLQGSHPGQGSPVSSSFYSPAGSDDDADEPGKGVFRTFPKIKKVRRSLRTRGRNCLRTPAHPRRRLSWRTPSSGCGSGNATLARRTSGTDVLTVQSGWLQMVSRSCGTATRMRRDGSGTGTGTRVSPRFSSLLFLLGEELYRQPRAVYKYWAQVTSLCPCLISSTSLRWTVDGASLQFLDRVVDIAVMLRDRYAQFQTVHYGLD